VDRYAEDLEALLYRSIRAGQGAVSGERAPDLDRVAHLGGRPGKECAILARRPARTKYPSPLAREAADG
jgi:hypothetical protein